MKFISAMKAERCVTQLLAEPDSNTSKARKALEGLKNSGPGAIPVMVDALASADRHQTVGIVDALASQVRKNTFREFVQGLCHPNERCVAGVAWALSSSNNYDPDMLVDLLTVDDVASHAVLDIMRSHLEQLNVRKLLKAAYTLEPREKGAVFKLIQDKATDDLIPELIARLAGRDHAARAHIVEILSKFSTPEVAQALQELLKDRNRQVKAAALGALGKMDVTPDIELVTSLLLDADLDVQNKATELLIKLRHPDTCKYLVGILKDESEYSRRAAVEILNELAEPDTIKHLLVAIGDSDWWVRSRACDALATIGGPKVLQAVMQLIGDKDENIRRSAIEILNQTKDQNAVQHLIAATHDTDWWVSERAVDALAAIGNRDAVPRLLEMLDENPKALPAVLKALGKLGDTRSVTRIISMLNRQEPEIISSAIGALTMLVDDSNVDRISTQIQPMIAAGNQMIAEAARDFAEQINNRFSSSNILIDEKAKRLAQPAHTMLIDVPDLSKVAAQSRTPMLAAQIDLSALRPGDMIETRYRYVEKIGKGAFGTVILVEDTAVDERLILKFLNPNIANDAEMMQRFVHELRFSRKITHKNVIRIYDFLNLSGNYAISMEYFPSHTLGGELPDNKPLAPAKAASWAQDIAAGMAVAHQVGVIHRDLKPANLLVNNDGLLKIVDFGVAAAAGAAETHLTKTGYVIGSPKYMAPEQILGKQVDHCADIYSTGVIFYEMLTGVPPYTKGDHMAIMYQHVQGKCVRCDEVNPAIPKAMADIVHTAMAVDKMKRYESMNELRRAIAAVT